MASLKEMTEEYAELRTRRMALEKEADGIKQGREAELKSAILLELSAQGIKTINFDGVGRITSRNKSYYEVQDPDRLAFALLGSLVKAGNEGRPLSDGLFLQRRVSSEVFETLLDEDKNTPMEQYGIAQVTRQELSLTKK